MTVMDIMDTLQDLLTEGHIKEDDEVIVKSTPLSTVISVITEHEVASIPAA